MAGERNRGGEDAPVYSHPGVCSEGTSPRHTRPALENDLLIASVRLSLHRPGVKALGA